MRNRIFARVLGGVVLTGALITTAACNKGADTAAADASARASVSAAAEASVKASVSASASAAALATKKASCDAVEKLFEAVGNDAEKLSADPRLLSTTYHEAAAKIRAEGKKAGGEVATDSDDLATALEGLADSAVKGDQAGVQSWTKKLTDAAVKLAGLCT